MSNAPDMFFLAVDGGGSKTLALIVDQTGRERGRGVSESSNHEVVGTEQAVAAIHQAVTRAATAAGAALPVASAWLGLAGIDHPHNVEMLLPSLRALATAIRITNDAELVLGALPDQVGVAVIAGTGSIALGRASDGRMARVGGWGHVFGDEGSGYGIGREALQCAARAADGRGPGTGLLAAILDCWDLAAPELMMAHVYEAFDKTEIAALAPLVFALARDGDQVARRIEARAARELALTVTTVARLLGCPPGRLPLAIGGGLLVHEERLRAMMIHRVASDWTVEPVVVSEPALTAALALVDRGCFDE